MSAKKKKKKKLTSKRRTNINQRNLITHRILSQQRHRVRDNDSTQRRARIQLLNRISTQYPMRHNADDLCGAVFGEHFGCCAERAAGVGHVVDEDGGLAADFAC